MVSKAFGPHGLGSAAHTATSATSPYSAGSRRRARRTQNRRRSMRPVRSRSTMNSEVIRYPLSTKNISIENNGPSPIHPTSACHSSMATTPTPRIPSSAGW